MQKIATQISQGWQVMPATKEGGQPMGLVFHY